jgi:rod shape-determining protein MreC
VLVLLSIAIITLDFRGDLRGTITSARRSAGDAVAPLDRAVDDVLRPVGSFLEGAIDYGSLQQQNAKLRFELARREAAAEQLQSVRQRLHMLSALEKLPWADVAALPTVAAEVIGQNSSNFEATVVLDKGSTQGVGVGMPVVDGAGLVGHVIQVDSGQCTVQLVTDVRSVVSVTVGTSGTLATVVGGGPGNPLQVQYVAPTVHLRRGMVLASSSEKLGAYPAGIPVARVTTFHASASATTQTVRARPAADLSNLSFVDIVQVEPPG